VAYFPESVNGLENGAPVKFQGVPVGSVRDIMIEINQSDKTFQVPVKFDIDLPRLTTHLGTYREPRGHSGAAAAGGEWDCAHSCRWRAS
jgi:hypothetical protein